MSEMHATIIHDRGFFPLCKMMVEFHLFSPTSCCRATQYIGNSLRQVLLVMAEIQPLMYQWIENLWRDPSDQHITGGRPRSDDDDDEAHVDLCPLALPPSLDSPASIMISHPCPFPLSFLPAPSRTSGRGRITAVNCSSRPYAYARLISLLSSARKSILMRRRGMGRCTCSTRVKSKNDNGQIP